MTDTNNPRSPGDLTGESLRWADHLRKCVYSACVLEAQAEKPGNVHPGASFARTEFQDFLLSAEAVAPILAQTEHFGVGEAIYQAANQTRRLVNQNTNLGLILSIAPLAAVSFRSSLSDGIGGVLESLTVTDARRTYEAIRIARPGGLGTVAEGDVTGEPTGTLTEMMSLAADRDRIARLYVTDFAEVLDFGLTELTESIDPHHHWSVAVERLALVFLAKDLDSHILRRAGREIAETARDHAAKILDLDWPGDSKARARFREFDSWLRADGNRRNPGTTADLVGATLFAGFRERLIQSQLGIVAEEE